MAQKYKQTIEIRGASLALLKRIKALVKAECSTSGSTVEFSNPTPECGGPDNPCPE